MHFCSQARRKRHSSRIRIPGWCVPGIVNDVIAPTGMSSGREPRAPLGIAAGARGLP
ncbi:MAG: hypothetical protein IPF66_23385 [Holophagales bacterium]|nr:hypothetical protein [Holophagales bacterium]